MRPEVTIIDYGMGNLLSVKRAFEQCGADAVVSSSPYQIRRADYLVLPGVGAFADGMRELRKRGLVTAIQEYAACDRPFLGICLGMQMMLDISEEFGTHCGLGLIPGRVSAIPGVTPDGIPLRIPHVGWSGLFTPAGTCWDGTPLLSVRPGTGVYFVHSFAAIPAHQEHLLATCSYNGLVITAAIRHGQLFGCQFHPEKSGRDGLNIISGFLASHSCQEKEFKDAA